MNAMKALSGLILIAALFFGQVGTAFADKLPPTEPIPTEEPVKPDVEVVPTEAAPIVNVKENVEQESTVEENAETEANTETVKVPLESTNEFIWTGWPGCWNAANAFKNADRCQELIDAVGGENLDWTTDGLEEIPGNISLTNDTMSCTAYGTVEVDPAGMLTISDGINTQVWTGLLLEGESTETLNYSNMGENVTISFDVVTLSWFASIEITVPNPCFPGETITVVKRVKIPAPAAPATCYEKDVQTFVEQDSITSFDTILRLLGNGELLDLLRNFPQLKEGTILSTSIDRTTRCWVYFVHEDKDGKTSLWKVNSVGTAAYRLLESGKYDQVASAPNGKIAFTDAGVVYLADSNGKNAERQPALADQMVFNSDSDLIILKDTRMSVLGMGKLEWTVDCNTFALMPDGKGIWCSEGTTLVPYYFTTGEAENKSIKAEDIAENPYATSNPDLTQIAYQMWYQSEDDKDRITDGNMTYVPIIGVVSDSYTQPEWVIDPAFAMDYDSYAVTMAIQPAQVHDIALK